MARPIQETPTLYGKEARAFIQRAESPRPLPADVRERLERARKAHTILPAQVTPPGSPKSGN